MNTHWSFTGIEGSQSRQIEVDVHSLVIAGWTGRDADAVERHVRELEAIGVRRPGTVPVFYRVAAHNLTSTQRIDVVGRQSTGEVEFVLVATAQGLWIGVGSDHTDRELEKHSVGLSKQVCSKPLATSLWLHDEVAAHWDELELHSHAHLQGERQLYQQGQVNAIRDPADLIRAYCDCAGLPQDGLPEGTVMFCGTLPVRGNIEFADRFEFELRDPRLGRSLRHAYDIDPLPLAD